MHLRLTIAAACAVAALSSVASAQAISSADFVKQASLSDRFELITSKIALKHASDPRVKDFAKQMIIDHTRSSQRLAAVAKAAHLKPETKLDAPHQALANRLNFTTGKEFDSVYMQEQVDAHKKAVALFTGYGKNGTDYNLKKFALDTVQTLQKHKDMATALEPKVSSGK